MARCGLPGRVRTGLPTVRAPGFGSPIGVGRGFPVSLGAGRPITTGAGSFGAAIGCGGLARWLPIPPTILFGRQPTSASSAGEAADLASASDLASAMLVDCRADRVIGFTPGGDAGAAATTPIT